MSVIASKVQSILNELFPANPHRRVFEEHFVRYKNNKLFFDFYVKENMLLVECQGRQHFEFVKHFHGTADNFRSQKFRDNLKIEYVQENDLYLIRLYESEKITKDLILDKINIAYDSEYNFCD